ncbi:MAG: hypothetical protein CFE26_00840 [Verrucomicrobiales bacterium VVV1]|nr:MAG: hypothetical protein CFE26_00840 [Verrucomicrobiales bacterium VVV1]
MKSTTLLLLAASPAFAGAPITPAPLEAKADPAWITPTFDIRARYEMADIDGYDVSHALTVRERIGFKTSAWNGLSFVAEGEFSQALIDDYSSGPGKAVNTAGVDPFVKNNSFTFDPETNELNQLYVQYAAFDTVVKIGRQQIVYDKAAFIGDVIWRQNMQTYDAVSITNKSIDGLTLSYAYVDQVNRIFGSSASGIFQDAPGELHLLNASYTGIKGLTLGGYVYLMDFDERAAMKWNNSTYGLSAKGKLGDVELYGEAAYQDQAGDLNNKNAMYFHINATKTFGKQSLTVGIEQLDAGFQTPLSTVHAFNGFADATDVRRLDGTHGGLTDTYVTHVTPIFWGIKWANSLHFFGDNTIGANLGFGADSVLTKKFDDHITAIIKIGYFDTSDKQYVSTTRASFEVNYAF